MNAQKEFNNQHRDNIIHSQQKDDELNQFKAQNEELKQQIIDLQTDNKLKDKLLHKKSQENKTLKREIEQLKKQLLSVSANNNKKIKPYNKRHKDDYENNIKNNNNLIIATREQKGRKIFEGYMFKKGKFSADFQNRYFILYANNTLSYYQHIGDDSSCNTSIGEINLYTIIDIKPQNENIFNLSSPKRTFTLKCHNKKEYHRWLQTIKLRVSPKIICSGWLHKKGERNQSWKLRYCALCELLEVDELNYEIRYYEDEQRKKYKGHINCASIEELHILPNSSIQSYGKDKVLQLVAQTRTYILAAKDTKSRNIWYKSLKRALFDADIPFFTPQLPVQVQPPHIAKSASVQSIDISFPSNEAVTATSLTPNHSKDTSKSKSMLIRILEPISERHSKQFNILSPLSPVTPATPLLTISNNNEDIDDKEWVDIDCTAVTPNASMDTLQIVSDMDEEVSISPVSSVDTEKLMLHNIIHLSSMLSVNRTFSQQSSYSDHEHEHCDDFYGAISYMSDNSLMLMDMNDEVDKLGHIINNTLDSVDMELLSVKNLQFKEISFERAKTDGCDEIIKSPVIESIHLNI